MNDNREIMIQALKWTESGRRVAVATVVSTWGSSPRPIGSRLVVDEEGRFIGSVSGGCVEGAVLLAAEEVIETDAPALLEFGVSDEKAISVGLACGGTIQIFVEKFKDPERFKNILERLNNGISTSLATSLVTGKRILVEEVGSLLELDLPETSHHFLTQAFTENKQGVIETSDGTIFIETWRPPLRLVIIGAVHIAQVLALIASAAGYEVTIVDPRSAFATQDRFPNLELITEWPDKALEAFKLNQRSAIVALTHDPKIDDPALLVSLQSPAFYIGALGSRRTAEKRKERYRAQGLDEKTLSRISGPVGLSIGAITPGEIAISIMAEITAVLHSADAYPK